MSILLTRIKSLKVIIMMSN